MTRAGWNVWVLTPACREAAGWRPWVIAEGAPGATRANFHLDGDLEVVQEYVRHHNAYFGFTDEAQLESLINSMAPELLPHILV